MPFGEWVKANNHWVGLAGLITATVIGVAAITYAVLTTPHAAISYKAKAISLVDATRVGGALKVTDQSGNKITSNVYAIEVAVWKFRRRLSRKFVGSCQRSFIDFAFPKHG